MSDFEDGDLRDRTPEKTKRSRNESSKSHKQTHKKTKISYGMDGPGRF